MPRYMLLLYDPDQEAMEAFGKLGPDEIQRIIERYKAWSQSLGERGVYVDSNKLRDEPGRTVRRRGSEVRVTDGPFSEAKEVLGGYYVIEADSYEHAVELSRDCPHLDYGIYNGIIAIREIEPVP